MFFMRASTTMRFARQSWRASLWRYSRNDVIGATRAACHAGSRFAKTEVTSTGFARANVDVK